MHNNSTALVAEYHYDLPISGKNVLYIIYVLTFVVGTSTNASVIWFIGIKHRLMKRFDVYIVSLATTDLLASIFHPIVNIHELVTEKENWYLLGNVGCKMFVTIVPFAALVSSVMLVLIATGRLRVIKSSVPIPQIRSRTIMETLAVWFFCFIVVVPRGTFLNLTDNQCYDPYWDAHFGYYIVIESLVCILPLVSMVVVYTASSCFILNKNVPTGNKRISLKRRQQYKNMTRMFFALVCVFIVCTAPHSIILFVHYHHRHFVLDGRRSNHEESTSIQVDLIHIFRVLVAVNHCINPYIYAKMHHNLGKYLVHLRRRWCRLHKCSEASLDGVGTGGAQERLSGSFLSDGGVSGDRKRSEQQQHLYSNTKLHISLSASSDKSSFLEDQQYKTKVHRNASSASVTSFSLY